MRRVLVQTVVIADARAQADVYQGFEPAGADEFDLRVTFVGYSTSSNNWLDLKTYLAVVDPNGKRVDLIVSANAAPVTIKPATQGRHTVVAYASNGEIGVGVVVNLYKWME